MPFEIDLFCCCVFLRRTQAGTGRCARGFSAAEVRVLTSTASTCCVKTRTGGAEKLIADSSKLPFPPLSFPERAGTGGASSPVLCLFNPRRSQPTQHHLCLASFFSWGSAVVCRLVTVLLRCVVKGMVSFDEPGFAKRVPPSWLYFCLFLPFSSHPVFLRSRDS